VTRAAAAAAEVVFTLTDTQTRDMAHYLPASQPASNYLAPYVLPSLHDIRNIKAYTQCNAVMTRLGLWPDERTDQNVT